jgi:hypothetical protein
MAMPLGPGLPPLLATTGFASLVASDSPAGLKEGAWNMQAPLVLRVPPEIQ